MEAGKIHRYIAVPVRVYVYWRNHPPTNVPTEQLE